MATALDYIEAALREIGELSEGETASAETSADALEAFNDMIDSWNTERLSVFCTVDQPFSWIASTTSRTLGPTGNFVGTRPVVLQDSTYVLDSSNNSYPITLINEAQYNAIALKTATSSYPQVLWVNYTFPDVTMYQYPVASQALTWHFISIEQLDEPAALATTIALPPGYRRAFKKNLAVEIANQFGIEAMPTLKAIARKSKANLKAINNPNDVMSMPYALIGRRRSNFNIFSGGVG